MKWWIFGGVFVLLALFLVIFFGVFVYASQISKEILGYGTMSGDFVETNSFNFEKGWNLVYGLPNPSWLSGGDIESTNIKAIYGFDPVTQRYVRFYPNPDRSELSSNNLRIDTMISTGAFWVYSDKKGKSECMTLQPAPLNEKRLVTGWNFVGITPDMVVDINSAGPEEEAKYRLDSMKGDCIIQKAYAFDPTSQSWVNFPLTEEIDRALVGMGLAVKVSGNCKLGSVGVESPPILPGEIISGSSNYVVQSNVGDITYSNNLGNISDCFVLELNNLKCNFYGAKYLGKASEGFFAYVEVYDSLTLVQFEQRLREKHGEGKLQKGDYLENDYYVVQEANDTWIYWYSNNKVVALYTAEKLDYDKGDYFEDLLTVYLPKYPSQLHLN